MASNLKRKAADLSSSDPKKPKAQASLTSFFGHPPSSPLSTSVRNRTLNDPTSSPPNPTSTEPTSTAPATATLADEVSAPVVKTFDKKAWAAKLTTEQRELLTLEIATLHESWFAHLKDELVTKEFLDLKRFLKAERASGKKIFPPAEDVYSWSKHTPLNSVKVVILGQDPYHNNNQAHGLCFSVRAPTPAPPSLKNMYKCLEKDYPGFQPPPKNGGLLTPWADRGVLLLNTCLTVRAHEANSHANKGWERFTQKVIDIVCRVRTRGVVFLAWGTPAQKRCVKINKMRHCVLSSVHPSPLSASRGFFDCGHFRKTNDWLQERYGVEGIIDWNLNVDPKDAGT